MWTTISVVTSTISILLSESMENEIMSWVFLIMNIISLLSNLGIEIYKQWKKRNDDDAPKLDTNRGQDNDDKS